MLLESAERAFDLLSKIIESHEDSWLLVYEHNLARKVVDFKQIDVIKFYIRHAWRAWFDPLLHLNYLFSFAVLGNIDLRNEVFDDVQKRDLSALLLLGDFLTMIDLEDFVVERQLNFKIMVQNCIFEWFIAPLEFEIHSYVIPQRTYQSESLIREAELIKCRSCNIIVYCMLHSRVGWGGSLRLRYNLYTRLTARHLKTVFVLIQIVFLFLFFLMYVRIAASRVAIDFLVLPHEVNRNLLYLLNWLDPITALSTVSTWIIR